MTNMSAPIQLISPEVIEFGSGTIAAVARYAREKGVRRPLVVADAFNAARVDVLALPGEVSVFGEVKPEPDVPNLDKALGVARAARPDLVVGFGGGSAMDLANSSPCSASVSKNLPTWSAPTRSRADCSAGPGADDVRHRSSGRARFMGS